VADPIIKKIESDIERPIRADFQPVGKGLSLGGLTIPQLLRGVWTAANDDDIIDRAAELAYYFLFALFPALLFLSAMFGLFASTRIQSNLELMLYLGRVIPPGAFGMVETTLAATSKTGATGNIVFGALAALWAATYGMSSAQSVLNTVYRVKERRPFWKAKAIALAMTLAIFVLVFCAMLLLMLGDYIIKLLVNVWMVNGSLMVIWKIMQVLASLFFMSLVFSITYHWGPDRKRHKWRWISPGAIVGICGWVAVSVGFRIYLHFFNSYTFLYGSVGTVIILLTWFYVSGLMLLLGAEINATIERAAANRLAVCD
jgi:membrane protein